MMKRNVSTGIAITGVLALLAGVGRALAAGSLAYNSTNIMERWQNDGVFNSQAGIIVTLTGDTFNTNVTDFLAGGQLTTNTAVPYGLTLVATRTATNRVALSLSGDSATNGQAANASFGISFSDSAFLTGPAAEVTNSTASLWVTFQSEPSNWYVNAGSGDDAAAGTNAATAFKTLTNAIAKAQANANDIINLAAGVYTVSNQAVGKTLTIQGNGRDDTFIESPVTNAGLLTYAKPGVLRHLTLRNGKRANGGAVDASSTACLELIVIGCRFLNNVATNLGGAVYNSNNDARTMQFRDTEFLGNVASNNGGAMRIYSQPVAISNCVFAGNQSGANGGVIAVDQYGVLSRLSLIGSRFATNTAAGNGGAVYHHPSIVFTVDGCAFAWNVAGTNGGALCSQASSGKGITVVNSTFHANVAGGEGGAIWEQDNSGSGAWIYNSTFFGNSAATGGAIRAFEGYRFWSTIVAGNTASSGVGPDCFKAGGTVVATNSLFGVTNGVGGATLAFSVLTPNSAGNFCGNTATNMDPRLLPMVTDGATAWTCPLQPDSLAIDRGTNILGLAWDQRGPGYARVCDVPLVGGGDGCDMGAYEYAPTVLLGTVLVVQ